MLRTTKSRVNSSNFHKNERGIKKKRKEKKGEGMVRVCVCAIHRTATLKNLAAR